TGSSDIYENTGRGPVASVNFIAAHDGFTLNDVVSYNEKHNEANGEGNADGESFNRSWNCGAEGPTPSRAINRLRERQHRNLMLTLLLSQGVPMIAHGDELGRTQKGNNNVYCQDNELSWVDWDLDPAQEKLLDFTRRAVRFRRDHAVLQRRRFFAGSPQHGGESELGDIAWLTPTGEHMTDGDWAESFARSLMVFLNGEAIPEPDVRGGRIIGDSLLVLFNGDPQPVEFCLPGEDFGTGWEVAMDTSRERLTRKRWEAREPLKLEGRSITVFVRPPAAAPDAG
ncbi:MAG TPA: glycogen debranching enzyme, partial [Propionibacteriaceae bacterium]|nr:glycogen debranching enzyme [Propionibacteriaceae bacterium]